MYYDLLTKKIVFELVTPLDIHDCTVIHQNESRNKIGSICPATVENGGTCNFKTGVNLLSLYFLSLKQRVESESEGVLLHPFL